MSARDYVLHVDPSATWSRTSDTEVSIVAGPESRRVRCGRFSVLVNRVGTGTYSIDELCRRCCAVAGISGGAR